MKTLIYIVAIALTCVLFQSLTMLPWYTFVIPCFFIGVYMGKKEVNKMPFFTGFLAGFLVWAGATVFFEMRFGGNSLNVMAGLLGMNKIVTLLLIGLVGALLTGLAVLSGYMLFKKEDKEGLKIKMGV
ncbi:MAG: hypothetical protein JNM68_09960 [Dinghuibacter sp.]|nr:hypothetical protein [Dinghuibacter sp.]